MTWRNYVKDGLAIVMVVAFTSLPPSVIIILRGETKKGLLFATVAITIFAVFTVICAYWRKRNIHISTIGQLSTIGLFIVSPYVVWRLGFTPWPTIILFFLFFGSQVIYSFIRDFIKGESVE